MKRSDVFPSKYLSKDDVATPIIAQIDAVRMETISGDRSDEDKAVAHFLGGNPKPMILKSTTWDVLEEAYGPDSDSWGGHQVEIYIDPGIMYAGKRVGGVRLRIPSGVSSNGTWTYEQSISAWEKAGGTKQQLVDRLKALGMTSYIASRDTSIVRQMIELKSKNDAVEAPAQAEIPGDDIPF